MNETLRNVTSLNNTNIIPATGGVIYCSGKDNQTLQKCTTGYCCTHNTGCCVNYVELWWFWLIWGVIIIFSCFCAYHHHRIQRNQGDSRNNNSRSLSQGQSTYVASCSYPGPPADGERDQMGYCKLPKYGDPQQTERSPPPPYRSVLNIGSFASILTDSWNSFWHQSNRAGLNSKNDAKENSEGQTEDMVETRLNLTQDTQIV